MLLSVALREALNEGLPVKMAVAVDEAVASFV